MKKLRNILAILFCSLLLMLAVSHAKAESLTQLIIDTVREARKVEAIGTCAANPLPVGNDGMPLAPPCPPVTVQCPARTATTYEIFDMDLAECDVDAGPWQYPISHSYPSERTKVSERGDSLSCNARVNGHSVWLNGYTSGGCILSGSQYGEDIEVSTSWRPSNDRWYGWGLGSGTQYELSAQDIASGQISCRPVTVRARAVCLRKPPESTLKKLEALSRDSNL